LRNKRVLVTGGAGFIGRHLVKRLVLMGCDVTVVDNFERNSISPKKLKDLGVKIWNPDLRYSSHILKRECKDMDVFIHLASKVGGIGLYTSKPLDVFEANCNIDNKVFELAQVSNIKNFFYASSSHIYPKDLQTDVAPPAIREEQAFPADPELSYGWAKLMFEKKLEFYAKQNPDMNIAIARYIGIYGEGQKYDLDTGSVIPVFSNRAFSYPEIPFSVWGTGQETRAYCYIDDAVDATIKMVEAMEDKKLVGPYNVGKQELTRIQTIAETVVDISGKDIEIEYDETKDTLIWGQWCDCSKIKRELGWEAKTSLRDGLEKVYADVSKRLKEAK